MGLLAKIQTAIEDQVGVFSSVSPIASDSSYIWLAQSKQSKYVIKVYDDDRSLRAGASHEIEIATILNGQSNIPELVFADVSRNTIDYPFAVFRYIEGETLLQVIEREPNRRKMQTLCSSVDNLISEISACAANGFGRLDGPDLRGISKSWTDYLLEAAGKIEKTFSTTPILDIATYRLPAEIIQLNADWFDAGEPSLTPIDLNCKNLIVTSEQAVILIDLKSFVGGDPLYSRAQFYAGLKHTPMGETYRSIQSLSTEEELKFTFYALLSNLNVLGYITRLNSSAASGARPWGNHRTFVELIGEHAGLLNDSQLRK